MTMSSVHACHVDRESLPSTCLRPDGKKSQSLRTSCEAVSGHRGGLFFNIFRNDQQTVFTKSFSSSAHFSRFCATALHVPRFLPGLLKNCSIASPHLLVGLQGILNPCLGHQSNIAVLQRPSVRLAVCLANLKYLFAAPLPNQGSELYASGLRHNGRCA